MKKKYKKVAVGGTFDKFHNGHKKLISTAFEMGERVLIGVTSDNFASTKNHDIEPFETRIHNINDFLLGFNNDYEVKEIFDSAGTADVDPEMDAIVVSKETEKSALLINEVRHSNHLILLDIIIVDWVLAYDGNPISSTRIRKGEINSVGKSL